MFPLPMLPLRWKPDLFPLYLSLFILQISKAYGYKDELYFKDDRSCDYKIHKLTQYEKIKITWDGDPFNVWCSAGFIGENPYNVHTKYRICVTKINAYYDTCDPKIKFYDNFGIWASEVYDCKRPLPQKWCSKYGKLQFKIVANEQTSSYLTVEISVEADVSLSIAGAVGIAVGVVAGLFMCCCCCYCCCCDDDNKTTEETTATPQNVTGSNYDYRQHAQILSGNSANPTQSDYPRSTNDEFDNLLRDISEPPATGSHIPMQEYGGGNYNSSPRFAHPQPSGRS
ncbi:hypothetical protein KUTeg_003883 [Tegillarca granosa]|uniref:Uncharacterized protein n=1 Tax=Tegillarca granosa TaxID=220873 RepID=A0ABQ9FS62_TEGGR|nr:hypothetical protein KUTeg_003883 [Tegillarca granosa]